MLTAPDGSILAANAEACRLLGRTEQEIRAAGQAGIFDASDPLSPARMQDPAAAGQVRGELTMIRADGSRFPVEFSSAVFTEGHDSQHTSFAFRDISERKRAEAAVAALNRQLEAQVVAHARQVATLLKTGRDICAFRLANGTACISLDSCQGGFRFRVAQDCAREALGLSSSQAITSYRLLSFETLSGFRS